MNSNSHNNTNNSLDQLDKGCFYCYKIVLGIYLGLLMLGTILLIAFFIHSGGNYVVVTVNVMLNLIALRLIIWQLEAIQKRDLDKATEALIGFVMYLVLDVLYILGVSFAAYGGLGSEFTAQACASLGIFVFCVFLGSVQVYLLLKKQKSGGYRNMNHVAP